MSSKTSLTAHSRSDVLSHDMIHDVFCMSAYAQSRNWEHPLFDLP